MHDFRKTDMKVIVDNKIPYIKEAIESLADEVVYLPGKAFTPEIVKDADALITRTRTRCDRNLLAGSKVKFIGTATIGFDHIDTAYCQEAGITWSNCPGCNAGARRTIYTLGHFYCYNKKRYHTERCLFGYCRSRACRKPHQTIGGADWECEYC